MKVTVRLAAIGGAAVLLGALGTTAASASTWQPAPGSVFVQTDNLSGNAVVAYERAADGSLQQAGTYPTGGLGGQLTGSVADHLSSQNSLVLDRAGGLLFAVNAGSNTVTVFAVNGDRLQQRQVISSGGTGPCRRSGRSPCRTRSAARASSPDPRHPAGQQAGRVPSGQ